MIDWAPAAFLVFALVALPTSLVTGKALNPFRQFGSPLIINRAEAPRRYWASIALSALAIPLFCWVIWAPSSI